MRRHPRVVLWGGRPGFDRQLGGRVDRWHADMEDNYAVLRRKVFEPLTPILERTVHEMRRVLS